ncbi:hypothetical protein [Nitrosomonas sp. Nm166]|uniref:hypothetical protein n=1 Tax=Nitrosomonas sp. Nm166 TaxID=1881054 RepID=UPI003526A599
MYPGADYDGNCFSKDVQALIHIAENIGFYPKILKAVKARNDEQKNVLYHKLYQFLDGDLKGEHYLTGISI